MGYYEIVVRKDIIAPTLSVNSPYSNQYFTTEPPNFNISINEPNLESTWYTIDGGITDFIFNGSIGTINQTLWNNITDGTIVITFYARDSGGNIGFAEVTVRKNIDFHILEPFIIDNTGGGNYTWAEASTQSWCNGSGTLSDPFVIEYITINGQNNISCIEINNSNVYFIIRNCKFYNGTTGIKLSNTTNGQLLSNNISNNSGDGINLSQSHNITISGNIVNNNLDFGIYFEYGVNNTVSGNTVSHNNITGIELWFSDYNTITKNSVNNNTIAGISLTNSTHNLIADNNETINYNGMYGIYLIYSDNNTISNNAINNNEMYGIYLLESDDNNITENTLTGNENGGIIQEDCLGNSIEDNTIPSSGGSEFRFPIELTILLSVIGATVIVVLVGRVVYKKKVSYPKKDKKGKLKQGKEKIIKKKITEQEKKKEIVVKSKLKRDSKDQKQKLKTEKQKIKVENKLRKRLRFVDHLIKESKIKIALKNLNEIEKLARDSGLTDFVSEAEQKILDCKKIEIETIKQIKQTVLNLGRKYTRLELTDISEKCGIKDEALIETVIQEMLKNKQIHGDYFSISKSLVLEAIDPVSASEVEKKF